MLKYMAIFQAIDNYTLGLDPEQLKRVKCITHQSPILDSNQQAKAWIESTSQNYPQKYYLTRHCVISFEETERRNVENMFKNLLKMF